MTEPIDSFPDFTGSFGDKRIAKCATKALNKLTLGRSGSIRSITESAAEQRSFYRLFNNESFTEEEIAKSIVNRCGEICNGRHVLSIQDTVEYNLNDSRGRIKAGSGLGSTGQKDILGFMMHHSFIVDASIGTALGYSYIKLWDRPEGGPDKHERGYSDLPIEEKESYKWIEASLKSKELLQQAKSITIVADRESDIYDMMALIPDTKTHILLRCRVNRQLTDKVKLYNHMAELPVMHTYELSLTGDKRKGTKTRVAKMEARWSKITVVRPSKSDKKLPATVTLNCVEVREQGKTNGIVWRLFTTHSVENAEQAMQIIEWYKQRWYIEQIHRLLKTDGFRIERSQLEQGWAIRKLTMLAMMAVLRILQLMLACEDESSQSIEEVFDEPQRQCLEMANHKLKGTSEKQSNPFDPKSLKWAAWIIARLGGWKAYTSQRKPGPIVLQKGLAKFYNMFEGWQLYQNYPKDVYTQ
jgi:hypothetical protein